MLADDLAMAILVSSNDGYLSNFAIGSLKFPFCSKWPLLLIWRILFVNLEDPFLSEIRKNSVRLVVPFSKNTTHPHPHHPPNDEIRLINTSVPKVKSWNCSITFFSSKTFCWDVMEIVTTKKCSKLCGGNFWRKGSSSTKSIVFKII